MNARGHNERSFRLDALAADARDGLAKVEQGEEFTIGGWLAYGHALNEGRALFPGDREFGKWKAENVLSQLGSAQPKADDEIAAMWAAANADQFEEARQRGNPRTIRGIHAKWKEIEAERAEEQRRLEAEAKSKADQETGATPDGQENKTDEPQSDAETGDIGATQSKPDQETPPNPADGAATPGAVDEGTSSGGALTPPAAPEPAPDPYGYANLTEEALLETANGLRADLDDEKARRKKAEAEARAAKAKLADLTADDKDEVIRRLQAEVKNAGNAKWKAIEDRDAYHRQVNKLKKRVTELEQMGVAY